MIKNITTLEHKIGERIYSFQCAIDSPLGEAYDALSAMKGFIVQRINDVAEAENKKPEKKDEEPEVEIIKPKK